MADTPDTARDPIQTITVQRDTSLGQNRWVVYSVSTRKSTTY